MSGAALRTLANFAGFQAGWFACVLGAAAGRPWLGVVAAAVLLPLHVRTLPAAARGRELALIAAAAGLGWAADSALVLAGALSFPPPARLLGPSALWMVALWALFAATLRHSLGWLRGRLVLAALFGAVGGPLAYGAGARLGAVALEGAPAAALAWIALEWALATPLLVALAWRRDPAPRATPVVEEVRP